MTSIQKFVWIFLLPHECCVLDPSHSPWLHHPVTNCVDYKSLNFLSINIFSSLLLLAPRDRVRVGHNDHSLLETAWELVTTTTRSWRPRENWSQRPLAPPELQTKPARLSSLYYYYYYYCYYYYSMSHNLRKDTASNIIYKKEEREAATINRSFLYSTRAVCYNLSTRM